MWNGELLVYMAVELRQGSEAIKGGGEFIRIPLLDTPESSV